MRSSFQSWDGTSTGVEVYAYPATAEPPMPSWEIWNAVDIAEPASGGGSERNKGETSPDRDSAWEARLAEEVRGAFEAGREQGFQQGRAAERQAGAAQLAAKEKLCVEQAARVTAAFQDERCRYFETVEGEVVKLALAVAARILRREAQMDPLLLTGAVRVALGQLASSTQVRLRVPPSDLELWKETIAHLPTLGVKPEVVTGEEMRLGDCRIETELGSVDLGVRAQLGEIESGFFDRAKPRNAPEPVECVKAAEMMPV